jgi:transcriptional regulator with XRE-family HTH domain
MSYFSAAFESILENLNGADIAQSAGFSTSTISLYRSDKRYPSRENIDALINALPNLADRWKVASAYLLDNCPREFLEPVAKQLRKISFPETVMEMPGRYKIDKDLKSSIQKLELLAAGDADLRTTLLMLARRM